MNPPFLPREFERQRIEEERIHGRARFERPPEPTNSKAWNLSPLQRVWARKYWLISVIGLSKLARLMRRFQHWVNSPKGGGRKIAEFGEKRVAVEPEPEKPKRERHKVKAQDAGPTKRGTRRKR